MNSPETATSLKAVVVVPARNEQDRIATCLDALATQVEVDPGSFEVLVVIDACTDETIGQVEETGHRWPELRLATIAGPGRGVGPARATGMDAACIRLEEAGNTDGLLATTDADTVVAPDWIARQIEAIGRGIEAIGGDIQLDAQEALELPDEVLERRNRDLVGRTAAANHRGPSEHAHFAGASLGMTPGAYRRAGGMGWMTALEDQDFEDRLAGAGVEIHRLGPVRVTTSARTDGRAERGLGQDLALSAWTEKRSYSGDSYSLERLLTLKTRSVAVVLPAKEVATTIGPILEEIKPLQEVGLIDELLVVDAHSTDRTAAITKSLGVRVAEESGLSPESGPCLGKGDAMWRAARAIESDLLVFLDADTSGFDRSFVFGLLGPMFEDPEIRLVKGSFRRPFSFGDSSIEDEGGRVTELVARPLLNLHFPALTGFVQPLAGEIAIERDLFLQLSVPVGYGVEIAMLVDCLRRAGLDALAQADLGTRQNRHQSLRELSAMAMQIMVATESRIGGVPRPAVASFRPRPVSSGPPERWNLHCEERPPTLD